jgi:prepilin-type N-terminal cleavage/methylation domain-containing protein
MVAIDSLIKMKKGFTLIEISVVLLVIGILAGIVLKNIGGQSAVARDTRRIGDLRNTANYLAYYLGKYGYFPNTGSWDDLEVALRNAGIVERLPRDPSGKAYTYYYCSDTGSVSNQYEINHFIVQAILEQAPTQAPRLWDTAVTSTPTGWTCNTTPQCNAASRQYCLAQ